MPAGLQVFNDNNTLTIDETYRNLTLAGRSLLTPDVPPFEGSGVQDTGARLARVFAPTNQPTLYNEPLLALRSSGYCAIYSRGVDTSTGVSRPYFDIIAWDGVSVEVYFFNSALRPQVPGSQSAGLEVFDASGVSIFNSNNNTMQIEAISGITSDYLTGKPPQNIADTLPASPYTSGLSLSLPSRKWAAFVPMSRMVTQAYYIEGAPPEANNRRDYIDAVTTSSTSISTYPKQILYQTNTFFFSYIWASYCQIAAIDVTNFALS